MSSHSGGHSTMRCQLAYKVLKALYNIPPSVTIDKNGQGLEFEIDELKPKDLGKQKHLQKLESQRAQYGRTIASQGHRSHRVGRGW